MIAIRIVFAIFLQKKACEKEGDCNFATVVIKNYSLKYIDKSIDKNIIVFFHHLTEIARYPEANMASPGKYGISWQIIDTGQYRYRFWDFGVSAEELRELILLDNWATKQKGI